MTSQTIPFLIAGPILRKTTSNQMVFWLVTREPIQGAYKLNRHQQQQEVFRSDLNHCESIRVGEHAVVTLPNFEGDFPLNHPLEYEF